ncbi:MAG TPA: polysaccharide biosynthesis tyrosine autokinase [Sphingomicrobium sp.]|nr:polysaccharide biosynthesis tyrosine autokinase [Sphingomicrobium sp.]
MSQSQSLVPRGSGTDLTTELVRPSAVLPSTPSRRSRGFMAALRRHRLLLFVLVAVGIGIGLLLALLIPPTYRAEAQIQFEHQSSDGVKPDEFARTQVAILHSRGLAKAVAADLKLDRNERVAAAVANSGMDWNSFSNGQLDQLIDRWRGRAASNSLSNDQLIDRLRDGVDVAIDPGASMATIAFDSTDPLSSAVIANGYVDAYARANLQRQVDSTAASRSFLEQRLTETKARLGASEKALIDYTRASGLIDPSAGTSSVAGAAAPHSLASDKLAQLTGAYSQARADRIAAEQRWQEAQGTPLMSLPEVLANPTIQQLTQKAAEEEAAYEQQRAHRLDTHPAVIAAAAQLAEIKRQIQTLGSSIKNSIRDRYEVARRQEADLAQTVAQLRDQTLADQGKGARYNVLKRNADSVRQLYDTLLQRFNDATTAAGTIPSSLSVIDPAQPPARPISPRPVLWSLAGGLIGLLLAMIVAFVSMLRDDRVHTPESVDADLRLRVLGVLPRVRNPLKALANPGSLLSEAHYSLRASLESIASNEGARTIAFTSSREGEGKTSAAFGVARDFALAGKNVLLIDGDMRKPSIQQYFDAGSSLGLSSVLAGSCAPEEAIVETSIPGLWAMPAGPMPESPAALLSGPELQATLKQLATSFDMVIVDAPPVFGLADAPRIAVAANSTVFVVETDRARLPQVRGALARLAETQANIAGIVLTKFDPGGTRSRTNSCIYTYPNQRAPQALQPA